MKLDLTRGNWRTPEKLISDPAYSPIIERAVTGEISHSRAMAEIILKEFFRNHSAAIVDEALGQDKCPYWCQAGWREPESEQQDV